MKKIVYLIINSILLVSCGSYLINYNENLVGKSLNINHNKTVKFSPHTFKTKVYYRDNREADYENNNSRYSDELSERLRNFADYQYIIERNDTIIYISTTPSPRSIEYRNYFFRHAEDALDRSTPNAYYFNTFLIGKKVNDEIIFKDDKNEMRWSLLETKNRIEVNSIDIFKNKYVRSSHNYVATISPSQSIDIGYNFERIDNFYNFFYSEKYENKDFNDQLPSLKEIILDYNEKNQLQRVLVRFNQMIGSDKNSVEFPLNRIKYSKLN